MKNYDRFRTWMLGHWTCHFEAGPWPSFILNGKLWLLQDLNDGPDGALDSCRLDASPSASYAMTNYHCFRTWIMGRWTCHLEAGPSARLHSQWQIMIVSGHGWWVMGLGVLKPILKLHSQWQILIVAGLVVWSWAFSPSSFLEKKYFFCTWMVWHRTCP